MNYSLQSENKEAIKSIEDNLSTEVTEEDLAEGKKILLYGGGIYSPDNKRLLVAPKNVPRLIVGEGTKVICDGAFNRCFDLEFVSIPDGITKIGKVAFSHCFALKTVSIPEGVTSIDDYAFSKCVNLKSVSIPKSVSSVGKLLFSYCDNLESIFIPIGTMSLYEKLLPEYKDKLVEQNNEENLSTTVTDEDLANAWTDEFGGIYSKDRKRLLKAPKGLHNYTIKNGTKVICDMTFCEFVGGGKKKDFDGIVSITIPDSVEQVGEHALLCCDDLRYIYIPVLTKKKFEDLMPSYKYKLIELLDINDKKGWRIIERRPLSPKEIMATERAEVVDSQFGNTACFHFKNGGHCFIKLVPYSSLAIGDKIDLSKVNIVTLSRSNDVDFLRVEI